MWHIMLMTWSAKNIDYFSVFTTAIYFLWYIDTEVQGSFHGSRYI